ncbi:hypothetical protein AV530_018174 [Patagioenas fasciata monilis]|uniref:Uncharacterized protein n=1 Tax=Patagioenas fasciata monilis TaxID=372326 RepID=A0A1V4KL49_PATFA|nr:hypothetical protein AV530_018174 [Patagioenas fasciata monilis]
MRLEGLVEQRWEKQREKWVGEMGETRYPSQPRDGDPQPRDKQLFREQLEGNQPVANERASTLFGTGEEVPVQQPLQEHSITMKMLQEHSITMKMLQELKSHQLSGKEHREAFPWTVGSDGVEMQQATFWC